jgi:pimeloyl-ACP methyl ester carboxylesterase
MPTQIATRFEQTMELADGRQLGYADVGATDGLPLLMFHGTPSSRLDAVWLDDAAQRSGWRLVSFDRPGHGLSSPCRGGTLVDQVDDVEALADALELEQFAVLGYSGGAPHALAAAAALDGRVSVVGLVSGWGPPDRPGAYEGVVFSERASDALARHAPGVTKVLFGALALSLRLAPVTMGRLMAARLEGGTDSGLLTAGPESMANVREAFRSGPAGAARDLHLIVSPWGFDPADVTAPVHLWHGDRDSEIPLHHARHLADVVPNGRLEVIEGGDHLALYHHGDAILTSLASDVPDVGRTADR